jgi:predicted nuclease of predicted toxin-antitoxin system
MKFLADEGVDSQIVVRLRGDGYDVLYAAELLAGTSDEELLEQANREQRILLTRDKDFGEIAYKDKKVHTGIILNRLHELPSERKAEIVSQTVKDLGEELIGAFTVIQPGKIRVKKFH